MLNVWIYTAHFYTKRRTTNDTFSKIVLLFKKTQNNDWNFATSSTKYLPVCLLCILCPIIFSGNNICINDNPEQNIVWVRRRCIRVQYSNANLNPLLFFWKEQKHRLNSKYFINRLHTNRMAMSHSLQTIICNLCSRLSPLHLHDTACILYILYTSSWCMSMNLQCVYLSAHFHHLFTSKTSRANGNITKCCFL